MFRSPQARAVLKRGKKRKWFVTPTETNGDALYFMVKTWAETVLKYWLAAVGGWRLAVGGWWRLAVGRWQLAVSGGWRQLAVSGWLRLAVGGPWGLTLTIGIPKNSPAAGMTQPRFPTTTGPKTFHLTFWTTNTAIRGAVLRQANERGRGIGEIFPRDSPLGNSIPLCPAPPWRLGFRCSLGDLAHSGHALSSDVGILQIMPQA